MDLWLPGTGAGATSAAIERPLCVQSGLLSHGLSGACPSTDPRGFDPCRWPLTANAVSGYSGGGKAMIAAFEDPDAPESADTALRAYGLDLAHKHVPEMQKHSGAKYAPLFTPAVARVYRGMLVEVPLQLCAMSNAPSLEAIRDTLAFAYEGSKQIHVADKASCEALGRMEIERSEEHTSELQSLMRISYAVFCLN